MNSDVQVRQRRKIVWSKLGVQVLTVVAVLSTLTTFATWARAVLMTHGDHWGYFGGIMLLFAVVTGATAGFIWDANHEDWS